jgi:hypothetical protein
MWWGRSEGTFREGLPQAWNVGEGFCEEVTSKLKNIEWVGISQEDRRGKTLCPKFRV